MITLGLPLLRLRLVRQEPFVNVRGGRTPEPPARDRDRHAAALLAQLDAVANRPQGPAPLADATGISVTATGERLTDVLTSLRDLRTGVVVLDAADDRAVLRVPKDLANLRRKIEQYASELTPKGNPRNQPLVARLETIAPTTLADLSGGELTEDAINPDAVYWTELWIPSEPELPMAVRDRAAAAVRELSRLAGNDREPDVFRGPDRDVYLVRLPGAVLRQVPALVPDVAEIHRAARSTLIEAAELADERGELVDVRPPPDDAPAVAVHDTGVAADHPYLGPLLLGAGSAVPAAGPEDRDGHGTKMAGIAAYRDLAPTRADGGAVADAWLVSVRLLETDAERHGGDEDRGVLWSARTALAIGEAEALAPGRALVHNMSIGATAASPGRRTAWSVAVDELAWNHGDGRLIVVAAGNTGPISDPADYPAVNLGTPHDDPAQAVNALTVGAWTALAEHGPDDRRLGAGPPLARSGQLSPYSATAPGGPGGRWEGKPEIVFEGGNTAPTGGLSGPGASGLSLLTTIRPGGPRGALLGRAWATSAAAAGASNALARVVAAHPALRPATARGLLVHTARWPAAARAQLTDPRDLLRSFGYGVPDPARASAASNRPVLLHEGELVPGERNRDGKPERRAVFVELPLPADQLDALGETPVELAVTLAYFVEPTASRARGQYAGARLRWDMQGPVETPDGFRARINRLVRQQGVETGGGSYDWDIGPDTRSRGTAQHDRATVPASAVAGTRLVAVYPVLGWWETAGLRSRRLSFSLIASVDLGDVDVDLYTLVAAALEVVVDAS